MFYVQYAFFLGRERGLTAFTEGGHLEPLAEGSGWSGGLAEQPSLSMAQALLRRWEWDLQYTRESDSLFGSLRLDCCGRRLPGVAADGDGNA